MTQDLFRRLLPDRLTLDVTARELTSGDGQSVIVLTPIVNDGAGDIPLEMSGAGRLEAAHLAAVFAREPDCLILDEPATNLAASAQRQVMTAIAERSHAGRQTILITHSGHLVPADEVTDLESLVRIIRCNQAHTHIYRLDEEQFLDKNRRLLRPVEVRDALFSEGVLLVEGATDYELLRTLLADAEPTPQAANVMLLPVDGDGSFVPYMKLLDNLGIVWAAFADGPAFKNQLKKYDPSAPNEDFATTTAIGRRTTTSTHSL